MLVRLLIVFVLVLLNGFFVGAEFALVRSRRTRLEALTRGGDAKARLALRALNNLPRLLSATQVGVTLASLGLGWVAESAFGELFEHLLAHLPFVVEVSLRVTLGATVALIVVTYFHVVFGELTPKAAALNHPEMLARWLSPPLIAFAWLVSPFTWVLSRSATLVLRGLGQRPIDAEEQVHSAEELRLLVEQSQEGGVLEQRDADLIEGVFEFSEKNAREVMTPRTDMVALEIDSTLDEAVAIAEESGFSRFPVYEETIDHVVGLVLAKDLLRVLVHRPETFSPRDVMRPVHVVPGTREVEEVLSDFKRLKEHMAIVLDEYGGTAGLVTMEDLLEEIVGEILDEYDEAVEPFARPSAGEVLVPGSTNIDELNERYSLDVVSDDYTTIGGWVFGVLGRLPVVGDRVTGGGAVFTVRAMDSRRIDSLSVDLHSAGDRRERVREE
ncbi:MAG: HlyC/CorC family transporter, partial [Gemmatimonadaceae bacterium]|nr:HlyC/CorC family transporter [Gemmatimonadaceae bacterium]